MMHHTIDAVIEFNNNAVRQLENYDYPLAHQLLRQALKLCKTIIKKQLQRTEAQMQRQIVSYEWSSQKITSSKKILKEERFIFSRGIYIHTPSNCSDMIKAILCYNNALVYHLLATSVTKLTTATSTKNYDLYLQRAKLLYRLSGGILKQLQPVLSEQENLRLLHVAIWNNLGIISYDLVDYPATKNCFHQLNRNLKCFQSKDSIASFDLYQNDILAMYCNAMLDVPTTAPCA
mmetsp:Transcript_26212/g.39687  ORF Transcript_26212/g.39687 Transcript_26212/m.39687 type:complete len:233 (+) Transcript_26212:227-925(+)